MVARSTTPAINISRVENASPLRDELNVIRRNYSLPVGCTSVEVAVHKQNSRFIAHVIFPLEWNIPSMQATNRSWDLVCNDVYEGLVSLFNAHVQMKSAIATHDDDKKGLARIFILNESSHDTLGVLLTHPFRWT